MFPIAKIPAPVTLSPVLLFALYNLVALWIHAGFNSPETVASLLSSPNRLTVISPLFNSSSVSVTAEIKENLLLESRKVAVTLDGKRCYRSKLQNLQKLQVLIENQSLGISPGQEVVVSLLTEGCK